MRLKTFTAKTMREAMSHVTQVMGEDAVIMASGQDKATGLYVVTAAIDEDYSPKPPPAPPSELPASSAKPVNRTNGNNNALDDDPLDTLADMLDTHGCPARVTQALLAALDGCPAASQQELLTTALASHYQFSDARKLAQGKPLLLVGPAAAGKTLTTAKFAAQYTMQGQKPTVISSDTMKAGGVEQLSLLTRILEAPLHTVEDPAALHALLHHHKNSTPLLIDTEGVNPFVGAELEALKTLCAAAENACIMLVLPAGIDAADAYDMATLFAKNLPLAGIIITRVDLARRLGSVLAALSAANVPLCDIGLSAKVVGGLGQCHAATLARALLLPLSQSKSTAFVLSSQKETAS